MLEPLPYHRSVRDHLKAHAAAAWAHFSSDAFADEHAEELRLALLKATYRLERESHPALYGLADDAASKLGVRVAVELYQGPDEGRLNASLYFVPDAARVVLFGAMQEKLAEDELRAVLGHELAHHLLWTADAGEIFTAGRVLNVLADADDAPSVVATLRLFNLATETFADRGGLLASGSRDAVIKSLVKVDTGLAEVDPKAFLAQAEEVLAKAGSGSENFSHPENFIRAKAITLAEAEPEVHALLEGKPHIDMLDLLRRQELAAISRDLVDVLLTPAWFQSDIVLGHAKLLFDGYAVRPPRRDVEELARALEAYGPSVLDYVAYLMVDFVAVDTSLDTLPLAHAQHVAEGLGLLERLERFVNKELKLTKKVISSVRAQREALLEAAKQARPAP